ncbi:MAG: hypothetical protein WD830_02730 [Chloroflexota bacterium]
MKRLCAAGAIASLLLMLFALPVAAVTELTGGCAIQVRSLDGPNATGNEVDEGQAVGVISEGAVGSQTRPFKVDQDGSVDFLFNTGTVFQNNTWAIYAQGLPIPILSGQDDNPLDVDETGVVNLNDTVKALPFRVVGTFLITGDLWGNDNASHCHGEGYVQLLGDPIGTIPWIVAAALIALSGVALLVATPYSRDWEVDPTGGEGLHTGPLDRL